MARTAAAANCAVTRSEILLGGSADTLAFARAPRLGAAHAAVGARASVKELHHGHRADGVKRRRERGETGEQRVVVDTELAGPALPVFGDMRSARHDGAKTARRARHEPAKLVVAERAVP